MIGFPWSRARIEGRSRRRCLDVGNTTRAQRRLPLGRAEGVAAVTRCFGARRYLRVNARLLNLLLLCDAAGFQATRLNVVCMPALVWSVIFITSAVQTWSWHE